jgi:hypothetical protein
MQTRLEERVSEHRVLFATRHEGQASQVRKHSPSAILPIQPEQGTLLRDLVRSEVATDGREGLAQFHSVDSIASIAKRAELCGIKTDMSRVIELTHPFPQGFLLSAVFPVQPCAF